MLIKSDVQRAPAFSVGGQQVDLLVGPPLYEAKEWLRGRGQTVRIGECTYRRQQDDDAGYQCIYRLRANAFPLSCGEANR